MANEPAPQLAARPLFGGAIAMSLPVNYGDASDLRQIPDNQEVFLSPSSDTSLVVEVLAMVEDGQASTDLWEAVKFHFESIAHDNASLSSDILTPPPNDHIVSQITRLDSRSSLINLDTPAPQILTGLQRIHKFSHNPTGAPRAGHEDDTPDEVFIGVALWRVWIENASTGTSKKADLVCSVNVNLSSEDGTGPAERNTVEEWWLRSVGSLRIRDWDLFGDTE